MKKLLVMSLFVCLFVVMMFSVVSADCPCASGCTEVWTYKCTNWNDVCGCGWDSNGNCLCELSHECEMEVKDTCSCSCPYPVDPCIADPCGSGCPNANNCIICSNICSSNEKCSGSICVTKTCPTDFSCSSPQICCSGTCQSPACTGDVFVRNDYYCGTDFNGDFLNSGIWYDDLWNLCSNPGTCSAISSQGSNAVNVWEEDCFPGCCYSNVLGTGCNSSTYFDDGSCSVGSTWDISHSCSTNTNQKKAFNQTGRSFNGNSSCILDHSCVDKEDGGIPLGILEFCQFNCSIPAIDLTNDKACRHRYCLDSDEDDYANLSSCEFKISNPNNGKKRTDYRYVLYEDSENWNGANGSCINKGGNLVQVVDGEVQNILNNKFSGKEYWIGLNDKGAEGKFLWPMGNILDPEMPSYWGSGEGDSSGEDCVAVVNSAWRDFICGDITGLAKKSYVCEFDYVFDCDDNNINVNSDETEICENGIDDNCNGQIDEGCDSISNVFWSNLKTRNTLIGSAQIKDTVLMNLNGTSLGGSYNYTITKQNCLSNCNQNLMNYFNPGHWVFENSHSYKFSVSLSELSPASEILDISSSKDNAHPFVNITFPPNRFVVLNSTLVQFNATVYDEDDFLNVKWYFGDGVTTSFDDYAQAINGSDSLSVNHIFNNSCGVVRVYLTAQEKERDQYVEDYVDVLVFCEGITTFSIISSPLPNHDYEKGLVLFNATETFVTNCSTKAVANVISPSLVEGLNCTYLHTPLNNTLDNHLTIEWDLTDKEEIIRGVWGSMDITLQPVQAFFRLYPKSGGHKAILTLNYTL